MFEHKKTVYPQPRDIEFCHLCGAEVMELKFASGAPYMTDVVYNPRRRSRVVVTGEGNHFNFKPVHNCIKPKVDLLAAWEADQRLRLEEKAKLDATVAQANDPTLCSYSLPTETMALLKRIAHNSLIRLEELNKQIAEMEPHLKKLRLEVALLQDGQCAVDPKEPAIGRQVRILRGEYVGEVGVVRWMRLAFDGEHKRLGVTFDGRENASLFYVNSHKVEVLPVPQPPPSDASSGDT